jgi:hypothetical protein
MVRRVFTFAGSHKGRDWVGPQKISKASWDISQGSVVWLQRASLKDKVEDILKRTWGCPAHFFKRGLILGA